MRKLSGFAQVASLLVIVAMVLAACGSNSSGSGSTTGSGSSSTQKSALKVALVTDIGGLNDNGFNHLAYLGYSKAEKQYGFPEKIIQTQSQNDYVNNLTTAAQAADLVIAVGFLMQGPLDNVAKQFPNKKFAIVDGCATLANGNCDPLPNVAPLYFKEQEAGCLVGAIAGQMEVDGPSKVPHLLGANSVGVVGGLSIPPVNRYIAGFKYCIKMVDPNVKFNLVYSQDFSATAKCKDDALSLINQDKADIIFQVAGGCGVGALDAAHQAGVYGIGVDADQNYLYPQTVITSALKRVDVAVYDTIDSFEKGQFSNNPPRFDLAHNGVGYAPPNSAVPADAAAKAQQFQQEILSGQLTPPEQIPS